MLIDDAHGAGVLGKTGRGALEEARVNRKRIIQTVTLSKSFGAYGGAILGSPKLRREIVDKSRMFVGCTPLPPPLANAALQGVALLQAGGALRKRLAANAAYVKKALRKLGLEVPETPGPIIPIFPRTPGDSFRLQRELLRAKIYPPFIKYPGGPAAGYYRFVISSEHTGAQLDALVRAVTNYLLH